MTMFTTLKSGKGCSLVGFLFQESANIIAYLTARDSQLS
jgi:hypothetical protein